MSARWHHTTAVLVTLALAFSGLAGPLSARASTPAQVRRDRAELERSVSRLEEARARVTQVNEQIKRSSDRLDRLVAAQELADTRLRTRVRAMYRTGETTFISVLMNARSFEEFATGWALLTRINLQDAAMISDLAIARARVARSARLLLALQSQAARELDTELREVAAARKRLAGSQAALVEYQRRVAAARRPRPPAIPAATSAPDSTPALTGSGRWSTAVASHYGLNFTGSSASGARIGPYSMICAHRTLPFGTLVEFEYEGKRAVARVVDRGPHTPGRTFDLGPGVARVLDFSGVHPVRYRIISR